MQHCLSHTQLGRAGQALPNASALRRSACPSPAFLRPSSLAAMRVSRRQPQPLVCQSTAAPPVPALVDGNGASPTIKLEMPGRHLEQVGGCRVGRRCRQAHPVCSVGADVAPSSTAAAGRSTWL
jgi:hypothetical protein